MGEEKGRRVGRRRRGHPRVKGRGRRKRGHQWWKRKATTREREKEDSENSPSSLVGGHPSSHVCSMWSLTLRMGWSGAGDCACIVEARCKRFALVATQSLEVRVALWVAVRSLVAKPRRCGVFQVCGWPGVAVVTAEMVLREG